MSPPVPQAYIGASDHLGDHASSLFRYLESRALDNDAAATKVELRECEGGAGPLPPLLLNSGDPSQGELAFPTLNESPLLQYARLLSRRYATDEDASMAVLLATLAGAIGPGRHLVNPLGGVLPASLNVMLIEPEPTTGRHILDVVTRPLSDLAAHYAAAKRAKGPARLRRERVILENRAAAVREGIAQERSDLAQSGKAHRSEVNRAKTQQEGEDVAVQLMELELEERPWLICNGINTGDLRDLSTRSYDLSLLNYSPDGKAWQSLTRSKTAAQFEILHALSAGFHGSPVYLGPDTMCGVVISNLWLLDQGQRESRGSAAIRDVPLWGTFLFADLRDLGGDLDATLLDRSELDDWWRERVHQLFECRVMKAPSQLVLSPAASRIFIEACNQHRREARGLPTDERRMAGSQCAQVLKIALLLHLSGDHLNADVIEADTLQTAIAVFARLSDPSRRRTSGLFAPAAPMIEMEIEKMVMKLRIHGPMRKRDLARRYNNQDYTVLESTLQKALDANLIKSDGEYFTSLN